MGSCDDIETKLLVIFAWYSDQWGDGNWVEQKRVLTKAIKAIPNLLAGKFTKIDSDILWDMWDALGSFPEKDAALMEIYKEIKRN